MHQKRKWRPISVLSQFAESSHAALTVPSLPENSQYTEKKIQLLQQAELYPIKAPNLTCEIGMSFYQYWHQLVHFQHKMSYTIKETSACHYCQCHMLSQQGSRLTTVVREIILKQEKFVRKQAWPNISVVREVILKQDGFLAIIVRRSSNHFRKAQLL